MAKRYGECDGFIMIMEEVISKALEKKEIAFLGKNKSNAFFDKNRSNAFLDVTGNLYFSIRNNNLALVRISMNLYSIISIKVNTSRGEVNLVDTLYRNCAINKSGEKAVIKLRKNLNTSVKMMELHRLIQSIIINGKISDLDEKFETHHVSIKQLNTQGTLRYVEKQEHSKFHMETNFESHRKGIIINTYEEFTNFNDFIIKEDLEKSDIEKYPM